MTNVSAPGWSKSQRLQRGRELLCCQPLLRRKRERTPSRMPRLIPHGGDWRAAQKALARAQERLYPDSLEPRWNIIDLSKPSIPKDLFQIRPRQGADLPLEKSFLSVHPETVALSSWLQKDDSYDLRLYESAGKETDVTVRLPFRAASCVSVDLNGRHANSPRLSVQADEVKLHLRPWQLVTLRFRPARTSDQTPRSSGPGRDTQGFISSQMRMPPGSPHHLGER